MNIVRIKIEKITDVENGIRLFSGEGRPGETFEDFFFMQQDGFISFPEENAQGLALVDGKLAVLIATDDPSKRPPGGPAIKFFYFNKTNYLKWDEDGNFELQTDNNVTINVTGDAEITANKVSIVSGVIKLGKGVFNKLLTAVFATSVHDTHTHTSSGPGSPSSPPIVPSGGQGQTSDTEGS